jgi:hypothetical protein
MIVGARGQEKLDVLIGSSRKRSRNDGRRAVDAGECVRRRTNRGNLHVLREGEAASNGRTPPLFPPAGIATDGTRRLHSRHAIAAAPMASQ